MDRAIARRFALHSPGSDSIRPVHRAAGSFDFDASTTSSWLPPPPLAGSGRWEPIVFVPRAGFARGHGVFHDRQHGPLLAGMAQQVKPAGIQNICPISFVGSWRKDDDRQSGVELPQLFQGLPPAPGTKTAATEHGVKIVLLHFRSHLLRVADPGEFSMGSKVLLQDQFLAGVTNDQ